MAFAKLHLFSLVEQVDDKLRLDASGCFSSNPDDEILKVEIEPESGAGFIEVYDSTTNPTDNEKWFIDYEYELDGIVQPSVRVTSTLMTKTRTYSITVLTKEEDDLYSTDTDIFPYEPDIHRFLPLGRSSFLFAHREAQELILEYLEEQNIFKDNGEPYRKQDITYPEQFRRWSAMQSLLIIMESNQVNTDDTFNDKKEHYENLMRQARNRASLRLDANGDGETDRYAYSIRTTRMLRR